MIKVIFLDIDNTLLDFDACVQAVMREGFSRYGLPAYEDWMFSVFTEVNNGLWRQIETGELDLERLMEIRWNRIFARLGTEFDGPVFEKYFRDELYESVIPVEGAHETVEYLARKYILCAASNGPYGQQLHRMEKSGLGQYMKHIFISGDLGAEKPSREFFDRCFERLQETLPGIRPEETLFLGDSLTADMAGGIAFGMKTCWLDRKGSGLFGELNIDHRIQSLQEIPKIL